MTTQVRIILRSGTSIEFVAADPAANRDWRGQLGRFDWTRPEEWSSDLLFLKKDEVAAVVITRLEIEEPGPSPSYPNG